MKKWIIPYAVAILSYFIIRHYSAQLHGNISWNNILFGFVIVAFIIAAIWKADKLRYCVAAGYPLGFVLGTVFDFPTPTPGGYTTNWAPIWTITLLIALALGTIWELVARKRKK